LESPNVGIAILVRSWTLIAKPDREPLLQIDANGSGVSIPHRFDKLGA
jgi:hypothetical protein